MMPEPGRQEQTVPIRTHRYLIYVPAGDPAAAAQALADCLDYAEREHPDWESAGIIVGRWTAVVSMLACGKADIVIISKRSDLPPDRIPRVIAVEEELSGPAPRDPRRPGGRRPHLS